MSEATTSTATETAATETSAATETAATETAATETAATEIQTETATTEATTEASTETQTEATTTEQTGAPEEYAEFTVPDGFEINSELGTELKTFAKELNLPQDKAQQIVDLGAKLQAQNIEAGNKAFEERGGIIAHPEYVAKWVEQSTKDFSEADLATAKKAVDAYGGDQFKNFLNKSGLGNHPEWVRFCLNAGKSVREEPVIPGSRNTATPHRSLATKMFGSDKE